MSFLVYQSLHACVSAQRQELSSSDLHTALSLRESGPPAVLEACDLAGLDALALPRPTPEECADPRSAGYWRACALAWNPNVRAARRELQRTLGAARFAGGPDAIGVGLETKELADTGRETMLSATFDLLALLGVGPSAVAREAARIDVMRAHSQLESAVWTATFDVERARVHLAASRMREALLARFLSEVSAQSARFEDAADLSFGQVSE